MTGEKRQPSSVLCGGLCGLDNIITCSPGEVYDPHHQKHLLLLPQTHTHCTYPAMQRLILTSVIFTEALRESNHESSACKRECSLFCWAVLLDSTPQHSCTHRPHATHADIKPSLQTDDARQMENTACRHTQITWHCQTLCNRITPLVALTVNGL